MFVLVETGIQKCCMISNSHKYQRKLNFQNNLIYLVVISKENYRRVFAFLYVGCRFINSINLTNIVPYFELNNEHKSNQLQQPNSIQAKLSVNKQHCLRSARKEG